MALDLTAYGTVNAVAAYTRHATNEAGAFDTQTQPSEAQVEEFLNRRSAMLNAWLAQAGYSVPVMQATAVRLFDHYAVMGAAGDVELSQRSAGYDAEDENRRENKFLREFETAAAFIASGALGSLGVVQVGGGSPVQSVYVGGAARGPIFTRTGFGNDPTSEQGTRERDGNWR